MSKKIAVVVRDKQEEALRMSIGLTLMDDSVDIFCLNQKLARNKRTALNIDTIRELELNIYSNVEGDAETTYLPTAELANRLLTYDHILPY